VVGQVGMSQWARGRGGGCGWCRCEKAESAKQPYDEAEREKETEMH
jgi:hypothetical protein